MEGRLYPPAEDAESAGDFLLPAKDAEMQRKFEGAMDRGYK
jgi:hypothetical protein